MNSTELKMKLDNATERVEKRIKTLNKLCKTLDVNSDFLLADLNNLNTGNDYLTNKEAKNIVFKYVDFKNESNLSRMEYLKVCEYNRKILDLIDNVCKLYEIKGVVSRWETLYNEKKSIESKEKIEIIWNFLNDWANKVITWYKNDAIKYVNNLNEFHNYAYNLLSNNESITTREFNDDVISKFSIDCKKSFNLDKHKLSARDYAKCDELTEKLTTIKFVSNSVHLYLYSNIDATDGEYVMFKFDDETLNKMIEEEKLRKYEDLCNRVCAVVGEITDVTNLSIGSKNGELNGIVYGTKGKARIETISAGGYNIQCFHYRVLVHKL